MNAQNTQNTRKVRKSRLSVAVKISLAAVICLVILAWGVLPARNYLGQRMEIAELTEKLAQLKVKNEELRNEINLLGTDEEIERRARLQFGLVRPGEEAYAILPAPESSTLSSEAGNTPG